jgi:SAM-dependent methyltransferase
MTYAQPPSQWSSGAAYEPYIGRWSRLVAPLFLGWLNMPSGGRWLEVGCGSGALTAAILDHATPDAVVAIDPSSDYVSYARHLLPDPRARFLVAGAMALPIELGPFDAVVSGLVLNFIPTLGEAVGRMRQAARAGGTVAAYVWDYAEGMGLIRQFWDAAIALDPSARELDEGLRFPVCRPEPLRQVFQASGLTEIQVEALEIETVFRDFDDYWSPFHGAQGPAPSYVMGLSEKDRAGLRERLHSSLPAASDGTIHLPARAWAVSGITRG